MCAYECALCVGAHMHMSVCVRANTRMCVYICACVHIVSHKRGWCVCTFVRLCVRVHVCEHACLSLDGRGGWAACVQMDV